jgi:hypothetical protein
MTLNASHASVVRVRKGDQLLARLHLKHAVSSNEPAILLTQRKLSNPFEIRTKPDPVVDII